jgi:hypothetical protein
MKFIPGPIGLAAKGISLAIDVGKGIHAAVQARRNGGSVGDSFKAFGGHALNAATSLIPGGKFLGKGKGLISGFTGKAGGLGGMISKGLAIGKKVAGIARGPAGKKFVNMSRNLAVSQGKKFVRNAVNRQINSVRSRGTPKQGKAPRVRTTGRASKRPVIRRGKAPRASTTGRRVVAAKRPVIRRGKAPRASTTGRRVVAAKRSVIRRGKAPRASTTGRRVVAAKRPVIRRRR